MRTGLDDRRVLGLSSAVGLEVVLLTRLLLLSSSKWLERRCAFAVKVSRSGYWRPVQSVYRATHDDGFRWAKMYDLWHVVVSRAPARATASAKGAPSFKPN